MFGLSKPIRRLDQKLDSLSDGWKMRVALSYALFNVKDIDLLILDEPTNHRNLIH